VIRQVRLFLCALQLMTRLPVPSLAGFQPDWIARSSPYYPVVGWIVGALSAAALLITSRWWPGLPAAAVAIGVGVLVTGGLHEDGLADTADGLGGGQTPDRRLEIMKDSRVGGYGVLALWGVLTIKAAALASLSPARGALVLVIAHGAARGLIVAVTAAVPYVGDPERAKLQAPAMRARWGEAAVAGALGLAPLAVWPLLSSAAFGAALAMVGILVLTMAARRLIGGFTGDVLGAVEQIAELGLVMGLSAAGLGR
jgi:adenosylcobinamide-GDP ribazoletransferase